VLDPEVIISDHLSAKLHYFRGPSNLLKTAH